jgi:hypothetical protein
MIKKIFIGIKRHPKRFLLAIAFGYSLLWAILEPILAITDIKTTGYNGYYLGAYVILSFIVAVVVNYPKKSVKFNFKNTNTKVEIVFGDLFKVSGHKIISGSEFFDSKIGKPVSPNTLLGVFIKNVLGNHKSIIDDAVNLQLAGKEIDTVQRTDGKKLKYEIGETITISHDESIYFLFALSKTDKDCTAFSSPSIMLKALDKLWNKVRTEGNGHEINIPLIGYGLSRVGLPASQLIQLILISLLKSAKERDLSSTIRVVLQEEVFEKVDLELIKNNWE